jgi:hypothetical protein
LLVLTALLPPKDPVAAEMSKALQATRAFAAKQGESLQEAIIDGNRLPDETYAGPDKAALIAMIKEKWAKEGAPGEVMKVGINSTDWLRSQRLEWQGNSWVKYDSSSLQGFVAVKSGDFAVVYHLNFIKNHMQNDRVTLSLFDDPKEAPIVQRKVRLKNVR